MKRLLLSVFASLLMSSMAVAQSSNPITSATVSPNPVESKASLTFDEPVNEVLTIVIKDLTGKVVSNFKSDYQGQEYSSVNLDMVESLKRGIYIIQITGASGKVKTLKFQKT
jgi:methionine-rich copper-binding protein CopC